ncbi:MAG: hypothetical protein JNJ71_07395 [Rubrivivax sp.]|nr:hypothetical protein [Rubrivivax sp.]
MNGVTNGLLERLGLPRQHAPLPKDGLASVLRRSFRPWLARLSSCRPWLALAAAAAGLANAPALADPMRPLGGPPASAQPQPARPASDGSALRPIALPPPGTQRIPVPLPAESAERAASRGSPGPAAAATPETDEIARAENGARLLAIRQDSQGQWHALFDDQWLKPGARLGKQTLIAIDPLSVRLQTTAQGARSAQALHLLPQLVPSPAPASAAALAAGGASAVSSAAAEPAPSRRKPRASPNARKPAHDGIDARTLTPAPQPAPPADTTAARPTGPSPP